VPPASIESISRRLSEPESVPREERLAAVAVILAGEDLRILLIRRVKREGDPWSGQIALPGGKMQEGDGSPKEAAIRETLEEVGIDLRRSARFLGQMPPVRTHTGTMLVVPSVFALSREPEVRENPSEVASHRWVGLGSLAEPEARATYDLETRGGRMNMPAYRVGDYVVWGLTHRIISTLLD
jgi:8-oxo-dGTP pyrophosphatase MutT (NUDIX family)